MRRTLPLIAIVAMVLAWVALPTTSAAGADPAYAMKELIRGSPIHGANGLAVDTKGRLLVASVFGSELVVVNRQTGEITDRLDADVDGPDDVAVGPDGSIYWTDIMVGEVRRLAPNGAVTKQFVAPGVNPIAFTADGRLFVGQAFFGDGLYEVDPALKAAPRVVIADTKTAPYPTQLNGFDFGPDGMLYSPQPFMGRVVRIDPETGAMVAVATVPVPPTSVEFAPDGRLYASLYQGDIVRINRSTGATKVVAHIPDAILDNMVFGPYGRLFVSDSDTGAVYRLTLGAGMRQLVPGGLVLPGGLALMDTGPGPDSLFVADLWSLGEYDARTGELRETDRQSRAGGTIVEPWTVAPDDGNVIVTSWMSNAVQIWDPEANQQVEVFTDFKVPVNAIRFQGDLVVSELGTGSVAMEDAQTGARSVLATGLQVPTGLAAEGDDLWVADWATGKVWKIVTGGKILTPPTLTALGLASPEGLAFDTDGSLLVVEAGAGRLTRVDVTTGAKTTVADGFAMGDSGSAAAPPEWAFSGVAVRGNGTIYVSGDVKNVVYKLRPTT